MKALAVTLLTVLVLSCGGQGKRDLIQNKGSDTLFNVAQVWAEQYKDVDPTVAVAVTGGGSGTGISALINGTVDIANASRMIKDKERENALKNGIDAVEHTVGFDALAVYVHKDNPIESITIAQLAAIYGEGGQVDNWNQIGIDLGEIVRVSRQNNSGTFLYFKEAVVGKQGDYKLGSLDMNGSTEVVDLVSKTPGAIGYSGLAYATDEVKLVPVSKDGGAPVAPSVTSAIDGTYPIARPLLMYTRGKPEGKVKEYMDWILSEAGQKILFEEGYAPVNPISSGD